MAARPNSNLHGMVPENARTALLLIDVFNDFRFPGGTTLARNCERALPRMAALLDWAHRRKIPVIYVNDAFGRWRSDFTSVLEHCRRRGGLPAKIAERLQPAPEDYLVLKSKASGFSRRTWSSSLSTSACVTSSWRA